MRRLALRKLALSIVTLLLAAFAVTGLSAPASAAPADSLYALVNQERAANGLPALARNPSIEAVAVNWANQMAASGTMKHNPSFSSQIPAGWTAAAENVAQGQPTAQRMHSDWMNSAGHRANILGDYTDIGIAFISVNGTTWGVEDFAKYPARATSAPAMPSTTAPAPAPPTTPAPSPIPAAPPRTHAATPTPTPTPTPTSTPQSELPQASLAEEPNDVSFGDPSPSIAPAPDATNDLRSARASQVDGNPAGAITLLGLALAAAVIFIFRSVRGGSWGRHQSW
ncbi:hypothetical protein GCM10027052_03440 [Parafrigoribacterium mesophilum]|uniref:CAP domain-containing protein n=1 Tax=Parafrigoribacterium mesophilum TaxID=433646 RepID=UPI0031FCFD74